MDGRGQLIKSYLRLNRSVFYESKRLWRVKSLALKSARFTYRRTTMARRHIRDCYQVSWKGLTLLDVGCGQKLAYTLAFAQQNRVIGIDTELPLQWPYVNSFLELLRFSGVYRAFKSTSAEILGMRRHFKHALSELTSFRGFYDVELFRMDATDMKFPNGHFDGVFSFSVFEHIPDPRKALLEVKRVLKPTGLFYLDLHLYTSIYGDHDPRATRNTSMKPPWKHIRPSCTSLRIESCYLNKVHLFEWCAMLREVFDAVEFVKIPGEVDNCRHYLTEDIRNELADYTEEELLTTTFIAVARRG